MFCRKNKKKEDLKGKKTYYQRVVNQDIDRWDPPKVLPTPHSMHDKIKKGY